MSSGAHVSLAVFEHFLHPQILTEIQEQQRQLNAWLPQANFNCWRSWVRPKHALKEKKFVREGAHVIVLGGPAMLIGLGGGAASSNASGEGSADLDFNSVQRRNPEVSRPPFL